MHLIASAVELEQQVSDEQPQEQETEGVGLTDAPPALALAVATAEEATEPFAVDDDGLEVPLAVGLATAAAALPEGVAVPPLTVAAAAGEVDALRVDDAVEAEEGARDVEAEGEGEVTVAVDATVAGVTLTVSLNETVTLGVRDTLAAALTLAAVELLTAASVDGVFDGLPLVTVEEEAVVPVTVLVAAVVADTVADGDEADAAAVGLPATEGVVPVEDATVAVPEYPTVLLRDVDEDRVPVNEMEEVAVGDGVLPKLIEDVGDNDIVRVKLMVLVIVREKLGESVTLADDVSAADADACSRLPFKLTRVRTRSSRKADAGDEGGRAIRSPMTFTPSRTDCC